MNSELRILHLEDNPDDAELIEMLLTDQGVACEIERVVTRDEFIAALDCGQFDVIISDFSLPAFDGLSALDLAREKRPQAPFLFVSGTLGEEVAINALKSGATDYILKQRMTRLGAAVNRAVADAEERQALQKAETAMIQSEFKYRQLFECLGEAALLADSATHRVLDTNRQAELLLERTRAEILGVKVNRLLSAPTVEEYERRLTAPGVSPERVVFEGEILGSTGRAIPVTVSAAPILLHGRRLILGLYRDVSERKRTEMELQRLKDELARYTGSPFGARVGHGALEMLLPRSIPMPDLPLTRILVVDDEARQMRALCDTLRDHGYETTGYSSGAEALAALEKRRFEIVLTDLMMPGMDGIALLRAAYEIDGDLVGIVMTGHGTIATAVEAMKAGARSTTSSSLSISPSCCPCSLARSPCSGCDWKTPRFSSACAIAPLNSKPRIGNSRHSLTRFPTISAPRCGTSMDSPTGC